MQLWAGLGWCTVTFIKKHQSDERRSCHSSHYADSFAECHNPFSLDLLQQTTGVLNLHLTIRYGKTQTTLPSGCVVVGGGDSGPNEPR